MKKIDSNLLLFRIAFLSFQFALSSQISLLFSIDLHKRKANELYQAPRRIDALDHSATVGRRGSICLFGPFKFTLINLKKRPTKLRCLTQHGLLPLSQIFVNPRICSVIKLHSGILYEALGTIRQFTGYDDNIPQ